ncbi:MAG TPA: bifunctional serine/threonine-protein kinase/formylglycine-generating enzyme family protein, partial [Rhodanobacteraceae bacterium]|nr:bifunctional serine/threonine-protein kinase/formylglycine-generating enzyme family protein [Rhodanobacteraceae bacterium]
MTTIEQLVTALRDGSLKLPAVFDALSERGTVPDEQYRREVAWLEQLRDAEQFNPQIVRALLAKMANMQFVAAPQASAPDEDVTHVFTATPRTAATPTHTDTTGDREPTAPSPPPDEDGTVVRPRPSGDVAGDAATVVQPPSHPAQTQSTGTGTGTGGTFSSSSLNTTAWQRMADSEAGEYATVGMLLKGRFLLERELGRGGMGVVYLARDERKVEARDRDPYVAVKVLNDEFRKHPDSLIALQRESRRSQQLAHDNIVRVYDFDKDRTIVFMTMEYIDGKSLKALIREDAYDGWPLAKARPLIEGMGWALKRAHSAGVVHSDFKPGNVMVTKDGVAKVFDFGIARAGKFVETAGEQTVFDASTLGALTPAYASLEMLRGADPRPSDDIYAYGCVVYELLTGKHPFDKVSAEVALKEGRKPPVVRGLTARQNKTLADAVAFHNEHRLQSALQVIDGLRHVSWRERARPLLIYGAIAAVVLAGGGYGISRYLGARHVNEVVSRFEPSNPQHYSNEDQALAALTGLGDEESNVVTKHSDVIAAFLLGRLGNYWDPAKKRYNYTAVQHVFSIRDQLRLYSPQLDARRSAIDQERNGQLNTLDTQLSDRTAAGALFQNQPDNVVETLDAIRAIDPNSALLDNAELKLKYDIAIGQSLDAGKLDQAKQQLALATRLFPKSPRLQQRATQLATLTHAAAAAARITATEQSVPEARAALGKLLASPSLAPEWQAAVAGSLKALHDDHAPPTQQLLQKLPEAVAGQAAGATTPAQIQQASSMVAMALTYTPDSKPLLVQRDRLAAMQQQQQAQLAAESAAAEVASRIQSLKSAAAAHDVDKATESLARIRALQPDNPFLKADGPQLLAETYIGQSIAFAERGKYRSAADALDKGARVVGQNKDLRAARSRMDFVADLMQARSKSVSASDIDQLRKRLATLDRSDADGVDSLQKSLTAHGELPGGSFAKLLDSLKPSVATAAAAPVASAAPQASATPHASAPMVATVRPITPTPGVVAPPAATADPCARPGMAGHGRICADRIGSGYGPALVVVPGVGGGAPFAMTRTEVTVGEFDKYCAVTHQCAAKGGSASLPVADIGLAAAKGYAAWLTQVTGYTYRLPTDAEWLHAAQAGQGW